MSLPRTSCRAFDAREYAVARREHVPVPSAVCGRAWGGSASAGIIVAALVTSVALPAQAQPGRSRSPRRAEEEHYRLGSHGDPFERTNKIMSTTWQSRIAVLRDSVRTMCNPLPPGLPAF